MSSRLKGENLLLTIAIIVCCTSNVRAFNELEVVDHQPTHFDSHDLNEHKNVATSSQSEQLHSVNLVNSKNESPQPANDERTSSNLADLQSAIVGSSSSSSSSTSSVRSSSGNLPAADQLNPRFELPPAQFSNSRQPNIQPNALEAALSGYGQVRKAPQFPTDSSFGGNTANSNAASVNFQRQPQMISVLSGGASLHQSVSWNPPATQNPPQSSSFNTNAFTSSASSENHNPFNSFNSAGNAPVNNEFVPSSPPKVHETNDYASHDIHVNSRPHSLSADASRDVVRDSSRDLSRDSSMSSSAPLQNSRQFDNLPIASLPANDKPTVESSNQAAKPKPAHTVVKNGDGKKDDVVIYYYYYYDDEKNKTSGPSTVSPSLDVIPSLDQYDNVVPKKSSVENTQPPKTNSPAQPSGGSNIVPVNKATEFKIDGSTFKFDTSGFTPITTTPASKQHNNLHRGSILQDRGVHTHVHNNQLYGGINGDNLPTRDQPTNHRSNKLHSNNVHTSVMHVDDDHIHSGTIPTQTERNSLRSSYMPATTTIQPFNDDDENYSSPKLESQSRSTNYPAINVINNVYRYQNGFTGIGPELDPSRQYAQNENYGLNLQKGSQKFLPRLPSPAFVDAITPQNHEVENRPNSERVNHELVGEKINHESVRERVNHEPIREIANSRQNANYETDEYRSVNRTIEERIRVQPANEFEPIAVHVHNHNPDIERVNKLKASRQPAGSREENESLISTPQRETIRTTTTEHYIPTQPTTYETTRYFETTVPKHPDTTIRNNHQFNTFNPNPIITIDNASPTTTTSTTSTTTTTQAPSTTSAKPSESPAVDDRKPPYGGRRRFGGNPISPVASSAARPTSTSTSSNSVSSSSSNTRGSNSNLASSRNRSRLSTTTTTTAKPRVRSTTAPSVSGASPTTRASSQAPRRGFFSSRNRGNEDTTKPSNTFGRSREESPANNSVITTPAPVSNGSTTTASSSGLRKFGGSGARRGFAPTRSRDASAISAVSSTTSAPVSRFSSSSTTSAPSNSINPTRLNSLRGRQSFSRSRQPAVARGTSSRGAVQSATNKKDEPIVNSQTAVATSDKLEEKKETSAPANESHSSELPASPSASSASDATFSSSATTESTTQQSTTAMNPRARNNPLFRSRQRSNLFGNRGRGN